MPRKPKAELTPFPKAKCWKKYRGGIVYYIGKNNGLNWSRKNAGKNTSSDAYADALAEWHELLAKLKADEQHGIDTSDKAYQTELRKWRALPPQLRTLTVNGTGDGPHAPHLQTALTMPRQAATVPEFTGPQHSPAGFDATPDNAVYAYKFHPDSLKTNGAVATAETTEIVPLIEAYLVQQSKKVPTQFNAKHLGQIATQLRKFQEFCEESKVNAAGDTIKPALIHVHEVAPYLEVYKGDLLKWLGTPKEQGGMSRSTVKKRLDDVRDWLLWCERIGAVTGLPRYLLDDFNKLKAVKNADPDAIENGSNGVAVFTVAEIRQLWALATDRMRLYLALALNCGYTQIDISSLRWEHYDAENHTLNRARHKTMHHATKPNGEANPHYTRQVHRLWPVTEKLLLKFATKKRTRLMLLDVNGNELLRRWNNENHTVSEVDSIKLAFNRLRKQWAKSVLSERREYAFLFEHHKQHTKDRNALIRDWLRADDRTFKSLRKTSADLLEQSAKFGELSSLFLAHADGATKKFYVNKPYEKLIPAVDHLRKQYALKL